MDYLKLFVIPFGGLKPGNHQFSYEIDDLFFEQFEYSEIKHGAINVSIDLEREEKMLVLHFSIEGAVEVNCDRCAVPFSFPVKGLETLIIKFGQDYHEEDDEIQIIPEGENQLDVSPFIYEYIHLALPLKRVHPLNDKDESTCNPLMIKRLKELKPDNSNNSTWDVLKNLNKN